MAFQKYFAHLPLERQFKIFKHEGLKVSTATLCDQLDALATTLANTHEAIWAKLRQEKSKPLLAKLFAWAKAQQARPDVLPSSSLAKALFYLVKHEAGLSRYLDDPAVPIDNNESERAVRPTVLGRLKTWARDPGGAPRCKPSFRP